MIARSAALVLALVAAAPGPAPGPAPESQDAVQRRPPNILLALADDWSWPDASVLGSTLVETPAFDRIASEGVLFEHAVCAAPQCGPARAALLTGRNIWQLREAGTHWSYFPADLPVYPALLEAAGYHVGATGKAWGPGPLDGWEHNPAGRSYPGEALEERPATGISARDYASGFERFLDARPDKAPFCFWFGAHEPHRGYERGSGVRAGKDPAAVVVPPWLPDHADVRDDLCDYAFEVEWFDSQLGQMLALLEDRGELDNTLIVVTGDNGMPFPRAKANLYPAGVRVPMAIRWGGAQGERRVRDFVSFVDLCPTFLEAAGVELPEGLAGSSLLPILRSPFRGRIEALRDHALVGRERHTHARMDNLGYPSRAIITEDYLYIRNYAPDRTPMGDAGHDLDAGPSARLVREAPEELLAFRSRLFDLRPAEELYHLRQDPGALTDVSGKEGLKAVMARLRGKLDRALVDQGDPRALGFGDIFDAYPRFGSMRPALKGFAEKGEYNPEYLERARTQLEALGLDADGIEDPHRPR